MATLATVVTIPPPTPVIIEPEPRVMAALTGLHQLVTHLQARMTGLGQPLLSMELGSMQPQLGRTHE